MVAKQINKGTVFGYLVIIGLILSILLFGSLYLGPLSLRNYFSLGLLIYGTVNLRYLKFNKVELLYFLYLLVLIICTALRGQLHDIEFYKNFLTFHVTSIGIIIGIPFLVNTPDKLSIASKTLACVYIANLAISIMQFMQIPIAWNIAGSINISAQERIDQSSAIMTNEDLIGASVIQGLFAFVVTNGYIIASYLPLAIQRLFSKKSRLSLYDLIIISLAVIAAFLIQQRMCFYVTILFVVILMFVKSGSVAKIFLPLILGIVAPFILDSIDTLDFGRLTNTNDPFREKTFVVLEQVLASDEWILGCDLNDVYKTLVIGHNSILDSLRRGGIFTLITYIIFLSVTIYTLIGKIRKMYKANNYHACAYAVCSLLFIVYSMTHSMGIQSGAPFFWIPYALMIASEQMYAVKKSNNSLTKGMPKKEAVPII